ncbi:hypothetical protein ACOMHN_021739 [Nucella lapillus]
MCKQDFVVVCIVESLCGARDQQIQPHPVRPLVPLHRLVLLPGRRKRDCAVTGMVGEASEGGPGTGVLDVRLDVMSVVSHSWSTSGGGRGVVVNHIILKDLVMEVVLTKTRQRRGRLVSTSGIKVWQD